MPQYIDFYLSENRYDKTIECLKEYCEKSNDFFEIEDVFYIIKDLEDQKREFFEKLLEKFNE
ncbi:MAG: hypothetical protein IJG19_04625 [Methanobrevibacter sp.]|nr:hypothetical protein [Methanobrevibacter sp.]MBR0372286.1 hypothetical protein [Methanobrevibacter sp.]